MSAEERIQEMNRVFETDALLNAKPQPILEGAILSQEEIGRRRRTEEQWGKRQNLFWTVIEHIPQFIFVKGKPDKEGVCHYLMANRAALKFFGLKSSAEVIGKTDFDLLPMDVARRYVQMDQEVLASGRAVLNREEPILPDGQQKWLITSKVPLRDHKGNIIGLVGISSDVTDDRHAREAWRQSEEHFQRARDVDGEHLREQAALLDAAQDAILVIDLEGRISYWNKSAEKLHGWSSSEVIGRVAEEFLYKDREQAGKARQALLQRSEWTGELVKHTKEGRDVFVQARWTLVRDSQGKPKSILAIGTDITEKKKLEAQFLRAQRMESIGTLAGGIAHDLNNVLAPVMMAVSLMREKLKDDESRVLLETLETNTVRAANLVRQVLSFARGIEGARVPVDLKHLVKELARTIRETFPKSINTEFELGAGDWSVNGDATQLHQVLLNLCVNARDSMPSGGNLKIGIQDVMLDENYAAMNPDAKPGPYVVLKVADTGEGIMPGIVDRIFEPFFTTKEVGKGTGLGLSTVLAIVKSHGGFINVYSELGKGSTFKVYLPADSSTMAENPQAEWPIATIPRGNGELILVVDDEQSVLDVTRKVLGHFGYRSLSAKHGAEAVALFTKHQNEISVVLTDMMMPIMDGPATVLALRTLDPDVKIIGASGLSENSAIARAAGAGVEDFLPKPYTAEALLRLLAKVLGK